MIRSMIFMSLFVVSVPGDGTSDEILRLVGGGVCMGKEEYVILEEGGMICKR